MNEEKKEAAPAEVISSAQAFVNQMAMVSSYGNKSLLLGLNVYLADMYHGALASWASTPPIEVPIIWNGREVNAKFVKLQIPKAFTAQELEDKILHVLNFTPFMGFNVKADRYFFDFKEIPLYALEILFKHLLLNAPPRANFSWLEPLQTLLLEKRFARLKHAKTPRRYFSKKASLPDHVVVVDEEAIGFGMPKKKASFGVVNKDMKYKAAMAHPSYSQEKLNKAADAFINGHLSGVFSLDTGIVKLNDGEEIKMEDVIKMADGSSIIYGQGEPGQIADQIADAAPQKEEEMKPAQEPWEDND